MTHADAANDMTRYRDFAPTGFDCKGLGLENRQDWIAVPVSRTRDSGPMDESNFEAALEYLGGESEHVEVHRFGHWGPGWFEIILVHPTAEVREHVAYADLAAELQAALANYPVLDEMDFSEREFEAAAETWQWYSVADRVDFIQQHCSGVSVFAARRDELPTGGNYVEYSALTE